MRICNCNPCGESNISTIAFFGCRHYFPVNQFRVAEVWCRICGGTYAATITFSYHQMWFQHCAWSLHGSWNAQASLLRNGSNISKQFEQNILFCITFVLLFCLVCANLSTALVEHHLVGTHEYSMFGFAGKILRCVHSSVVLASGRVECNADPCAILSNKTRKFIYVMS